MKSLLTALCLFVSVSAFGANFPYIRLNNKTNRLSDSGSALTFNGSPVSVFPGIVSNSVVTSGLLAVGAGKTNGIAATPAHIVSTLGFTPANSNSVVNATAGSVINTVASAGLLSVDSSKTNGIAATAAHINSAINGGSLTAGGFAFVPVFVDGIYSVTTNNGYVSVVGASTNRLPAANSVACGRWFTIKAATTNGATVWLASGDTIDYSITNESLAFPTSRNYMSDGTNNWQRW